MNREIEEYSKYKLLAHWFTSVIVAGILLLLACSTPQKVAFQEPAAQPNSILWKIEGEDINTSYLFGTIHLIQKEEYFFTSSMQEAFDACQVLALEFDIGKAMDMGVQMGLLQKAFMRNDTTLSDLLSDADYDIVKKHFDDMGMPLFMLERVKPMFLTIFASEDMMGGDMMEDVKSYELELADMAKARKMKVEGLETMEYQLSIFDSIPYSAQAEMLVASIQTDEETEQSLDSLVFHYKQQNLHRLDELINADPTTKKYRRVLLDNRNRNWIPVIQRLLDERPLFIAVGAGHLNGEFGLIQLLRNEGYSLSPVINTIDANN
ncbi:MAG: TraB/GumN family protein [Saprospiraceae bacterium]|nr:TraB/GumN family protein [Saprospiraceae bacterium]